MSSDFIIRLVGTVVFTAFGVYLGVTLGRLANISPGPNTFSVEVYTFIFGLLGSLVGLILTPFLTIRPLITLRKYLVRVSAQTLFASFAGLIVGLIIAALVAFPVSMLPTPFGDFLPFVGVLLFSYLGVAMFTMRKNDLFTVFTSFSSQTRIGQEGQSGSNLGDSRSILLDTSVIIDGRISDIARTGFLPGILLIPRFVLNELQYVADSADGLRRQRGRRGMEVLAQLQKESGITVQLSDIDVEGVKEVDDKLVILARQMRSPILTNDYNLNRIAELQGVTVLNVNELANAVKSVVLPGELLGVRIIQEGKESEQGVGYMEDGTMVVVEGGRDSIDREIEVTVTKVLQTAAGRMVFARPVENG
ncbi:MAG: TRAM domain-containing protein [Anaerolineaceae bacterium]|nr:TRAM domain-containing protein [Anaerolineaceae bacterium]